MRKSEILFILIIALVVVFVLAAPYYFVATARGHAEEWAHTASMLTDTGDR